MRGKKSYLARRRWLAAFLAVLWRRLVAASWLPDGGSKQQRRCSVFFSVFPWPSRFGFSQVFNSSFLFLCFGLLFFFLPFPLFSRSVFFLPLFFCFSSQFSLLSGLSPFFLFFLSSFRVCVLGSIYRAKRRGFLWLHMGGRGCGGWSAIRVQLSRRDSPVFCMARGGWSASGRGWRGAAPSVFWQGMRSRERQHTWRRKNPPFCFLPLLHVHGRKKEEQCRSKRHRSDLLFFFFAWNGVVLGKTRRFI